jgi:hypothetical protein
MMRVIAHLDRDKIAIIGRRTGDWREKLIEELESNRFSWKTVSIS